MIIAYSLIARVAWKQESAIKASQVISGTKRKQKKFSLREMKASKTVALVFSAFVICYLPVCILTLWSVADRDLFRNLQKSRPNLFMGIYIIFVQALPPLNSCVNPLIYAVFSKIFRKASRTLLYRILGKPISNDTYYNYTTRIIFHGDQHDDEPVLLEDVKLISHGTSPEITQPLKRMVNETAF